MVTWGEFYAMRPDPCGSGFGPNQICGSESVSEAASSTRVAELNPELEAIYRVFADGHRW